MVETYTSLQKVLVLAGVVSSGFLVYVPSEEV